MRGAWIVDQESGERREVRAAAVVNATGVWIGDLQRGDRRLRLRPTKGIHVLVPRARVGNVGAVVLTAKDARIIFVIPWGDALSLIGTTDTDYRGDRERVEADGTDVAYLLDVVNAGFPEARLTAGDVVGTYAGLRPLVDTGERRESDISRKHEIVLDPDGLLTVAGGKLTTARAMADDVFRRLAGFLPPPPNRVDTRRISLAEAEPDLGGDVSRAAAHAGRHEMALHVDDVMIRRLGWFHERADHGMGVAPQAAEALGQELGWDATRRAGELARFRALVAANDRWREGAHG